MTELSLTPEQFANIAAKLMIAEEHTAAALKILEEATGVSLRELAAKETPHD